LSRYERHEWLAQRVEQAIDPAQPIIDPHHHLWSRPSSTYLAAELHADTSRSHNITHTVFVECAASYDDEAAAGFEPVGETRFVAAEAAAMRDMGGSELAAIAGHADLTMGPRLREVLHAHIEAGQGLFRGIRHGANWSAHPDVKNGHHNPPPHLFLDTDFQAGVQLLAELDLSLEAWQYFDQLSELAALAQAVPACTIIVNHLGAPLGIGPHATDRAGMLELWRSGLTEVAAQPNTVLKVGGIGMEHYYGTGWADLDAPPSSEQAAEYWQDVVHFAIDAFGPNRCMFESNFPVDRQTLPYTVLWNALQILATPYTAEEQQALFTGTAARAYRIEL